MPACNLCSKGFRLAQFKTTRDGRRRLEIRAVRCICESGARLSDKIPSSEQAEANKPYFVRFVNPHETVPRMVDLDPEPIAEEIDNDEIPF